MTALLTRPTGAAAKVIDLFCGYGGTSGGVVAAGGDLILASNHDDHAIDVHAANHPHTEHVRADLLDETAARYVDPITLPPCTVLTASPSCRHHSKANAKSIYRHGPTLFNYDHPADSDERYAASERSRTTMLCPLRYAAHHQPEAIIVENVVEAAFWGDHRDGSTFRWWLNQWRDIGYDAELLFLNSGFFPPCPQSRDRMYMVFWKRGNRRPDLRHRPDAYCSSDRCGGQWQTAAQSWRPRKKGWPLERWGKWGQQYDYRCTACGQVVTPVAWPAATAIDFTDLGPTLAERDRPLKPKTLARIERGVNHFADWPPVVVDQATGAIHAYVAPFAGNTYERPGQVRGRHALQQLFSQTGTLEHGLVALVTAGFAKFNGGPGDTAWHGTGDQLGTVTARDTTGLMSFTMPLVHANSDDRYRHVFEQLATLTTARERYLTVAAAGYEAGALDPDRVHFRMLKPHTELRAAMAFPEDFILAGTKTQVTKGLGNAVTPPVAEWITRRVFTALDAQAAGEVAA